jgi:hypothetical protein
METMEALVMLAEQYERVILHHKGRDEDGFFVTFDGSVFAYRAERRPTLAAATETARPAPRPPLSSSAFGPTSMTAHASAPVRDPGADRPNQT